ncbi:MAG: PEP-CTERM sorting domain-containing protein [Kiritimatiellae bacterium]|nr:PEP-CTERM sorting domain-containing protein [Kiritimatiellia bacterium]
MKKIFIATFVAIVTYAVNASYLYWQVRDDEITAYNATDHGEGFAYTPGGYFKLVQEGAAGTMVSTTYDSEGSVVSLGYVGESYSSLVVEGYSYYIEMYNSSGSIIAKSQTISSSEWGSYVNDAPITADLSVIPPTLTTWHGGSFAAVPEPTSAMLMLFGAAFLGLKRKNRRIA